MAFLFTAKWPVFEWLAVIIGLPVPRPPEENKHPTLQVLDFLLEADGLDDTLIKHFHDVNANQFEELPPNTQARLMLRVLRDAPAQPTGIAEAALGALNMLKNLAEQLSDTFAPGANLEALKPTPQLFTEVCHLRKQN